MSCVRAKIFLAVGSQNRWQRAGLATARAVWMALSLAMRAAATCVSDGVRVPSESENATATNSNTGARAPAYIEEREREREMGERDADLKTARNR